MRLEQLDQLGEVSKRAGQAVDLVDHHDIDLAGSDVGEQGLQGRAFQRPAGEARQKAPQTRSQTQNLVLAYELGNDPLVKMITARAARAPTCYLGERKC